MVLLYILIFQLFYKFHDIWTKIDFLRQTFPPPTSSFGPGGLRAPSMVCVRHPWFACAIRGLCVPSMVCVPICGLCSPSVVCSMHCFSPTSGDTGSCFSVYHPILTDLEEIAFAFRCFFCSLRPAFGHAAWTNPNPRSIMQSDCVMYFIFIINVKIDHKCRLSNPLSCKEMLVNLWSLKKQTKLGMDLDK